jgi:tRNA threonylcarbamoyl adenosine modification protein YjeE
MATPTVPLYDVVLPDLAATEALAQRVALHITMGDVIALRGDLGAGKTTFARALLRHLGVIDDVPSPTFTLLQTYDTPRFSVSHFDLYRLQDSIELDELGWDDALVDGVTLVEWPERALNRLPRDHLLLDFAANGDGVRSCSLAGTGSWLTRLEKLA